MKNEKRERGKKGKSFDCHWRKEKIHQNTIVTLIQSTTLIYSIKLHIYHGFLRICIRKLDV